MRRFAAILAALTALFSCTPKTTDGAGEEGPSLPADARFSLFGGRERILCRWQGLPEAAASIRFIFPEGTAEITVSGPDGEAFLSGRPDHLTITEKPAMYSLSQNCASMGTTALPGIRPTTHVAEYSAASAPALSAFRAPEGL